MTARLSPAQRRQHANLCRYRDNAADALKRLTDNTLAETIRRGHMAITDGYAAGYNHDRTTGGSPGSSTETAALALLDGGPPDPAGEDLADIVTRLTEIAGHAAAIDRALDNLRRGTGWDPGRYDPTCRNCGDKASNHPERPNWRLVGDRCEACDQWWRRHDGEERPKARSFGGTG